MVHGDAPGKIVTDGLGSDGVAHRELIPGPIHDTSRYANNRAELSHRPTRLRERGMRRFKSAHQAQRFLGLHAAVYNLFNLGRHLVSAKHYREFRQRAFAPWKYATEARRVWFAGTRTALAINLSVSLKGPVTRLRPDAPGKTRSCATRTALRRPANTGSWSRCGSRGWPPRRNKRRTRRRSPSACSRSSARCR